MRPAKFDTEAPVKSTACNPRLLGVLSTEPRPGNLDHSTRHSYDLGFSLISEKLELTIDFTN